MAIDISEKSLLSLNNPEKVCNLLVILIKVMDFNGSPGRDIRNSSYNYVSNTSQHYQEEFWKLKAQKAAATIEELKIENQALNKRIIQLSRIQQELREKIIYYEDDWKNRSRRLTTERVSERLSETYAEDKFTSTHELERLYKEIRIIKNTHQVQMTKLKEENKKLKKQIEQNKSLAATAKAAQDKLKEVNSINNETTQLKKKIGTMQENLGRIRDEKAKLMSQNDQLRKQIQDIRLKEKVNQKQEEQKLLDYKKRLEELNDQRINHTISEIIPIVEAPKLQEKQIAVSTPREEQFACRFEEEQFACRFDEDKNKILRQLKETQDELQAFKTQIKIHQRTEAEYNKKLTFAQTNLQNEKFSNQIRIKKLQGELIETKTQLSDVIRKLSPLLQKNQPLESSKQNADCKANLTILQIFLKKYRIQSF